MHRIEKHFASIEAGQEWLKTLQSENRESVTVTIALETEQRDQIPPKRRFSETPLCGLWKDREDIEPVSDYVRELRKPRFIDVC